MRQFNQNPSSQQPLHVDQSATRAPGSSDDVDDISLRGSMTQHTVFFQTDWIRV